MNKKEILKHFIKLKKSLKSYTQVRLVKSQKWSILSIVYLINLIKQLWKEEGV